MTRTTKLDLWAWAERFSDRAHTMDELARLGRQVYDAHNTCGSCTAWMTKACPRERRDRAGRKHGPSKSEIKCDRFAMSAVDAAFVAKAEEKMAALRLRLQADGCRG